MSRMAGSLTSLKRIALFTAGRGSRVGGSVRSSSEYKPPANWFPAHYDEMPVPIGSWQIANSQKQRKYNRHLVGGILFLFFTCTFAQASGKLIFHFSPPPLPYELDEEDGGFECKEVVVKKIC